MKKILTLAFLLLIVTSIEAQKMQQISVYKNGNVLYSSILTVSDSIKFSKFTVLVTTSGVDINGVIWATCNVGSPNAFTSSPSEFGMFYQWNRPVGWSSSNPLENHEGGTEWDNTIPSGDTWEISNNVCPSGWRLPTQEELNSLVNSGSLWGELNGVKGRFFGNGEQRVFLPAAGIRSDSDGTLNYQGLFGGYWSSTPYGSEYAHYLYFDSGYASTGSYYRSYGFSVRCVSE